MASSWGLSWGTSWASSWGAITSATRRAGGYWIDHGRKKRRRAHGVEQTEAFLAQLRAKREQVELRRLQKQAAEDAIRAALAAHSEAVADAHVQAMAAEFARLQREQGAESARQQQALLRSIDEQQNRTIRALANRARAAALQRQNDEDAALLLLMD